MKIEEIEALIFQVTALPHTAECASKFEAPCGCERGVAIERLDEEYDKLSEQD